MDTIQNDNITERLTIEETFEQLEELTEKLESNELGMEDSFALYAKGLSLVKECRRQIDHMEKKVLILSEDGTEDEF